MAVITELLRDLCNETKLNFRLIDNNNIEIFDNLPAIESNVTRKLLIGDKTFKIILEQDNIKLIPMVEYLINKLIIKENPLEELIEGRKQWDALEEEVIKGSSKLLLIEVNNKNEVLDIVRDTYDKIEVYVGEIYDRIVVIGDLEDEFEHAMSIRETIAQILGVQAKVSIADLDNTFKGFIKAYNGAVQAIKIGTKFKIMPEIYNINEMYLERAIFSLSNEYLQEITTEYKDIFKGFNHELIQTLEEVLRCDLSLTKASKNLYIHRNTLMYRIEKIKKETGFDIRNFKEATFLYILYMSSKVNY